MSEALSLTLVLLAGMLLGTVFFGGLWWTVRRGLVSPNPAQWFVVSLFLRLGITVAGFYAVAGADGLRLLLCLLGFIFARVAVVRLTARHEMEVQHAP